MAAAVLVGVLLFSAYREQKKLETIHAMEAAAMAQFMEKTAPQLAKTLGKELGVSDVRLEGRIETLYDRDHYYYYSAERGELHSACHVTIISNEIERYYTPGKA